MVGRLRLNEWTDRNGEKRSRIQVVADAVQFLGKPTKSAEPDDGVADADDEPVDRPALASTARPAAHAIDPRGGAVMPNDDIDEDVDDDVDELAFN